MQNQTPNTPIATLRDGAIKAAIWRNETENGARYSVEFSRSYKTAEGEWRDSHSFSNSDLLRLSLLATRAYTEAAAYREQDQVEA